MPRGTVPLPNVLSWGAASLPLGFSEGHLGLPVRPYTRPRPPHRSWGGFPDRWTGGRAGPLFTGWELVSHSDHGHHLPACTRIRAWVSSGASTLASPIGLKSKANIWLSICLKTCIESEIRRGKRGSYFSSHLHPKCLVLFSWNNVIILPQVRTRKSPTTGVRIFSPSRCGSLQAFSDSRAPWVQAWEQERGQCLGIPRKRHGKWGSAHLLWVLSTGVLNITRTWLWYKELIRRSNWIALEINLN